MSVGIIKPHSKMLALESHWNPVLNRYGLSFSSHLSPGETERILRHLHLIYENLKLSELTKVTCSQLLPLLYHFSQHLNWWPWMEFYILDGFQPRDSQEQKPPMSSSDDPTTPPCIFTYVTCILRRQACTYPKLPSRTHLELLSDLLDLCDSLKDNDESGSALVDALVRLEWTRVRLSLLCTPLRHLFFLLLDRASKHYLQTQHCVSPTVWLLLGRRDLAHLTSNTTTPPLAHARPTWRPSALRSTEDIFKTTLSTSQSFLTQSSLTSTLSVTTHSNSTHSSVDALSSASATSVASRAKAMNAALHTVDPNAYLTGMSLEVHSFSRFYQTDDRVDEAMRLLQSALPIALRLPERPGRTDHDLMVDQQISIYAASVRTLSLACGRALLTFQTMHPTSTQTCYIPSLSLAVRFLPHASSHHQPSHNLQGLSPPVELNEAYLFNFTGLTKKDSYLYWPEFHNGVAVGLSLIPGSDLEGSWLFFQRPDLKVSDGGGGDVNPSSSSSSRMADLVHSLPGFTLTHASSSLLSESQFAGFVLGLALQGALDRLSESMAYSCLARGEVGLSVALLLGLSVASTRRRCSRLSHAASSSTLLSVTSLERMIRIHLPAMQPSLSGRVDIEKEVPASVQVASLLSLGFLHLREGHPRLSRFLLDALCSHESTMPHQMVYLSVRGAYALSAGIALGCLTSGHRDDALDERLLQYASQPAAMPAPVRHPSAMLYESSSNSSHRSGLLGDSAIFHGDGGVSGTTNDPLLSSGRPASTSALDDVIYGASSQKRTSVHLTSPAAHYALIIRFVNTRHPLILRTLSSFKEHLTLVTQHFPPHLLTLRVLTVQLIEYTHIPVHIHDLLADLPDTIAVPFQSLFACLSSSTTHTTYIVPSVSSASDTASLALRQSAYAYIAGMVTAMGLKYAGTQDTRVAKTLQTLADELLQRHWTHVAKAQRLHLLNVTTATLLAWSLVVAGSGDLACMARLRRLHGELHVVSPHIPIKTTGATPAEPASTSAVPAMLPAHTLYGHQMVWHQALGFLFLGGGQYGVVRQPQCKEGVSDLLGFVGLLLTVYPQYPTMTHDQSTHLQAMRHLWVLAVEQRRLSCQLLPTVESGIGSADALPMPLSVRVEIVMQGKDGEEAISSYREETPLLLPDLSTAFKVSVVDERYETVTMVFPRDRALLLRNDFVLYVQARREENKEEKEEEIVEEDLTRKDMNTSKVVHARECRWVERIRAHRWREIVTGERNASWTLQLESLLWRHRDTIVRELKQCYAATKGGLWTQRWSLATRVFLEAIDVRDSATLTSLLVSRRQEQTLSQWVCECWRTRQMSVLYAELLYHVVENTSESLK